MEGAVKVVMSLTHGNTITVYEKLSEQILPVGTSSTIQILRKNHKVLLMINGVETNVRISVNFTESKFLWSYFLDSLHVDDKIILLNVAL